MPNIRRRAFLSGNDKLLQSRVRKSSFLKREEKELARRLKLQRKKIKIKRLNEKIKAETKREPGEIKASDDVQTETDSELEIENTSTVVAKSISNEEKRTVYEENKIVGEDNQRPDRLRKWESNDKEVFVFLEQNQSISISGTCLIKSLIGTFEINGKLINNSNDFSELISEKKSPLFTVKNHSKVNFTKKKIIELLKRSGTFNEGLFQFIKAVEGEGEINLCFMVKPFRSVACTVLNYLNGYKVEEEIQFYTEPYDVPVLETENWKTIVDESIAEREKHKNSCHCSTMLIGGKNVGKSSFCRYTINRLLNSHDDVYFLECDCGQTEFTPPGVLSLVRVKNPLLGPPFTHQLKPVRSYFYGYTSPKDQPNDYYKLLAKLFRYYVEYCQADGPLIINTQGWVRGVGLSLLVDLVGLMDPCHVIQIDSDQDARNLPQPLSDEFLQEMEGWVTNVENRIKLHSRRYTRLDAVKPQQTNTSHKGLPTRHNAITAYFSRFYPHSEENDDLSWAQPTSLLNIQPYVISFCDIALYVLHEKISDDLLLHSFNASLVTLSNVPKSLISSRERGVSLLKEPLLFPEYLGMGIVRNIDVKRQLIYLLTPEPMEVLDKVNLLIKGDIQLPPSYLTQENKGSHPYVCYDYESTMSKGSTAHKRRTNLKRLPSRMRNSFG